MPAPIFGRVEKPEQLNLSPFKFTLIGYRPTDDGHEEAPFDFTVSGVRPFYVQIELIRAQAAGSGILMYEKAVELIEMALLNDEERTRWRETLGLPDVSFEVQSIVEIAAWLDEAYADRPTKSPTASRSSRARGGRRSTGARSERASATSANGQPG